jgi:hypothetical protein
VRGDDDAPRAWRGWRLLVSGAALSLNDFAVGRGELVAGILLLCLAGAMALDWL